MRLIAIVMAALGAASVAAAQGVEAPKDVVSQPPLVLEVTVRQYAAENRMAASAGDSGTDKFESYVWATSSLCGLGASNSEPATVPGVGWHFTAEVLSSSASQMSISVRWQRMWDNGVKSEVPKGIQEITLRSGERVELDRVLPAGPSPCGAVDARLEAAVVARPAYRMTAITGRLGVMGGRGIAAAGGVVGRGVVGGTGTATATGGVGGRGVSSSTASVSGRGAAAARGLGVAQTPKSAPTFSPPPKPALQGGRGAAGGPDSVKSLRVMRPAMYDAELWLVHRGPNGTETVQQQTVRFDGSGATYAFPPIQVSTARGTITLDITGKLQAFVGDPPDPNRPDTRLVLLRAALSSSGLGSELAQRIMLSISRRARATGAPLLDITGGSSMAMDMPSATDVLSFEFPALQKATEDLLKGHQFSLRMRLTPIAKQAQPQGFPRG